MNKNPRGKPRGIFYPDYISPVQAKLARTATKGELRLLPFGNPMRKVPAASRGEKIYK